jgi:hypothetical protein
MSNTSKVLVDVDKGSNLLYLPLTSLPSRLPPRTDRRRQRVRVRQAAAHPRRLSL